VERALNDCNGNICKCTTDHGTTAALEELSDQHIQEYTTGLKEQFCWVQILGAYTNLEFIMTFYMYIYISW